MEITIEVRGEKTLMDRDKEWTVKSNKWDPFLVLSLKDFKSRITHKFFMTECKQLPCLLSMK